MTYHESGQEALDNHSLNIYKSDPEKWYYLNRRNQIIALAVYIIANAAILVFFFPSIDQINEYLKAPGFQSAFPYVTAGVGFALFILKTKSPSFFGASKIVVAIAVSARDLEKLSNGGISEWVISFGCIYLFCSGFENLFSSLTDTRKKN